MIYCRIDSWGAESHGTVVRRVTQWKTSLHGPRLQGCMHFSQPSGMESGRMKTYSGPSNRVPIPGSRYRHPSGTGGCCGDGDQKSGSGGQGTIDTPIADRVRMYSRRRCPDQGTRDAGSPPAKDVIPLRAATLRMLRMAFLFSPPDPVGQKRVDDHCLFF
jgi:hypothetical protein